MKKRLNIALILSGAMLFFSSSLFAQNLTVEGLSTLEGGTVTGSLRPLTSNTGSTGMNTIGVFGGNSENKFINFRAGGGSFSSTGIMFSNFSVDHFLMYRTGNGLSFRFSNENTDLPSLTSTTEYMVLSTSGNLGIGEPNPTESLEVNGNVKATNFIGDGSMLMNINVEDADADAMNEIQDLELSGNTLSLTDDATTVDLSGFVNNWTTYGEAPIIFGFNNTVAGDSSSAVGYNNKATGFRSSAFGHDNLVTGDNSSAVGYSNVATLGLSSAFGYDNFATAEGSSALGYFNGATGPRSNAVGYFNRAGGFDGNAFGYNNTASGEISSAFGYSNDATGDQSSAFGSFNNATGLRSSAFGYGTFSDVYGLMAVGHYNADPVGNGTTWVDTDPVFVIGNGEDVNNRSTALTILKNGNVGIGTSTPSAKLDVNGTLISDTLSINGNELADNTRINFRASDDSNRFQIETDLDGSTVNDLLGFRSFQNDNILVLKGNGNVGIGTIDPQAKLDVNGTARIRNLPTGGTNSVLVDANGNLFKSSSSPNVNEQRINDQQAEIEDLQKENKIKDQKIAKLEAENEAIKSRLAKIEALLSGKVEEISTTTSTLTSATLSQNAPNPFDEVTRIDYFIPEGVKNASLQVMNQNGRIIKIIPIQATGEGQVTLQANILSAGTYSYSLVLDGQVMETKQMVLTH